LQPFGQLRDGARDTAAQFLVGQEERLSGVSSAKAMLLSE
jgi:hypothetical protein